MTAFFSMAIFIASIYALEILNQNKTQT